jgi:hypothetical protein
MDESYIFSIHEYMEVEHGISEQYSDYHEQHEQHEHQERHEQIEQMERMERHEQQEQHDFLMDEYSEQHHIIIEVSG